MENYRLSTNVSSKVFAEEGIDLTLKIIRNSPELGNILDITSPLHYNILLDGFNSISKAFDHNNISGILYFMHPEDLESVIRKYALLPAPEYGQLIISFDFVGKLNTRPFITKKLEFSYHLNDKKYYLLDGND